MGNNEGTISKEALTAGTANTEAATGAAANTKPTNAAAASEEMRIGDGLSLPLVQEAVGGDISAMSIILRQFDGYIRRLARLSLFGTSYLNEDLYEDLKTRLIVETLRFKLRMAGGATCGIGDGTAAGAAMAGGVRNGAAVVVS